MLSECLTPEFYYHNKHDEKISVLPTRHAIQRFSQRYEILMNRSEVESIVLTNTSILFRMMEVFNKGVRYSTVKTEKRNAKRNQGITMIHIISEKYKMGFVVNPVDKVIVTSEIIGALRSFNKIPLTRKT